MGKRKSNLKRNLIIGTTGFLGGIVGAFSESFLQAILAGLIVGALGAFVVKYTCKR